jgi:TfoX/Sxy family transcriptional regulator of competence genes
VARKVTWKPSPPRLVRAFEAAVAPLQGTTQRKMFGYPAIFLRGHMIAGLVRDRMVLRLVLRLADRDQERFLRLAGAEPFVAMGRTMRQWAMVPPTMAASPARLRPWLRRALTHGRSLPAKPSRPPRAGRLHKAPQSST